MISNKEILEYSLDNPVDLLDDNFRIDRELVIIPRLSSEDNDLTTASKALINLFTTMKTLNETNDFSKDEDIARRIIKILKSVNNIHFFPFNFYCQTQGVTKDNYFKLKFEDQLQLIKDYITDRHEMYLDHGYTSTVLQTTCDSYAHKRQGDPGTRKLRMQAEAHGIRHIDFDDDNYYLNPDKGDEKKFKEILNDNRIDYKYFRNHNSKLPDLFMKINNNYVIVEHKHMTTNGGHQNAVIVDVMEFINESDANVYYVSYIDGTVFKDYFGLEYEENRDDKYNQTVKNINSIFDRHERSYILNTHGFDLFIDKLLEAE